MPTSLIRTVLATRPRRTRRPLLAAALAVAVVAGCSDTADDPAGAETTGAPPPATDTVSPVPPGTGAADDAVDPPTTDPVAALEVSVAPSPHSVITAAVTVRTIEPARVALTATSGDHVVEVPLTAALANDHVVPLAGMRSDREYAIAVDVVDADGAPVASESVSFTTGPLPAWFADFEFESDPARSSPGFTLIEASQSEPPPESPSSQYLIAVDADGEVVWYYQNTGVIGGVEMTPAGTFLSHYWPFGVREFDLFGNVVGNWQFQPLSAKDAGELDPDEQAAAVDDDLLERQSASVLTGNPGDPLALPVRADDVNLTSFHHEAWPMPSGNLLVLSTTDHDLTPEQRSTICPGDAEAFGVVSDVVVEFEPSGRVVRTWDLWDAIDIDEVPGEELCNSDGFFASEGLRDWTHANAAVYDEARDAVIVSSRHTNQVIAFEHLDAEGPQSDVRWVFGEAGTMPLAGDPPYYQHAVEVGPDGSILLYDNGNNRPGTTVGDAESPTYSRAVLYDVDDTSADPAEWTVTQRWEFRMTDIDGSPLYATFLGDADRMENGNVLVTNGGIDPEDGFQHALIVEVVPEGASGGEIVWRLVLGTADEPYTVYRAERVRSLYAGPDWLPRD